MAEQEVADQDLETQRAKLRLEERASSEAERDARFNRRFRLLELRERREDRALREKELATTSGRGVRFTSGQATVAAAALAVFSAVAGGLIQAWMTRDVERLRSQATIDLEIQKQDAAEKIARAEFETTLILKAIEAPSRETQIRNLKFFLNAGFISDEDGKIAAMKEADYPSLPPPNQDKGFSQEDITSAIEKSVGLVTIEGSKDSGEVQSFWGIFFIISDEGLAVTSAHLFDKVEPSRSVIELRFSNREFRAELVSIYQDLDVAILKLPSVPQGYFPLKLSRSPPSVGEPLFATGSTEFGRLRDIRITRLVSNDGPGGYWLLAHRFFPGQSGAPIFNLKGETVAFVVKGFGPQTSVRPVHTIWSRLADSGVPGVP